MACFSSSASAGRSGPFFSRSVMARPTVVCELKSPCRRHRFGGWRLRLDLDQCRTLGDRDEGEQDCSPQHPAAGLFVGQQFQRRRHREPAEAQQVFDGPALRRRWCGAAWRRAASIRARRCRIVRTRPAVSARPPPPSTRRRPAPTAGGICGWARDWSSCGASGSSFCAAAV